MEKHEHLLYKANKSFRTADHLAYVTYPLVKDTKLIMIIAENLYKSLRNTMDALLEYDRLYKRIGPLPNNFNSKFDIFKRKTAPRYNINNEQLIILNELRELVEERKKSPMEFVRRDKYVIASSTYRLKSISIEKVKDYLNESKGFVKNANKILIQDGR